MKPLKGHYPDSSTWWFSKARDFVGYAIGSGDCELAIVHNLAGDEKGDADCESRARLITAAPDLLAALKALVPFALEMAKSVIAEYSGRDLTDLEVCKEHPEVGEAIKTITLATGRDVF